MSNGPQVKLELSCFGCDHCKTSSYTCQGDSGSDVFCGAMNNRVIGDTNWKTPEWCPYRFEAVHAAIAAVQQSYAARSYAELVTFLSSNGIGRLPTGAEEIARSWRGHRTTDAELLAAIKECNAKATEGTRGVQGAVD